MKKGWFATHTLTILIFAGIIIFAIRFANIFADEFTLSFPPNQTESVSRKVNGDIQRIEDLGDQFAPVARFLRMKFDSLVEFSQTYSLSINRGKLAAGAALPVEASSRPKDEQIFSDTETIRASSKDTSICDFAALEETFPIKNLRNQVEYAQKELFPVCIKQQLSKNTVLDSSAIDGGIITSTIRVSLDSQSRVALQLLAVVLFSMFVILLLKLYRAILENINFRAS